MEAGFGPSQITTNLGSIIPTLSLRLHNAFRLNIKQAESGETKDYLRFMDLLTGCVTVRWDNDMGAFKRETICSYKDDVCATRLTPPAAGMLNVEIDIIPPVGGAKSEKHRGEVLRRAELQYPGRCTQKFDVAEEFSTIELAYFPEYGNKGCCTVVRLVQKGGKATAAGRTITVSGADSLQIISRTVKYESSFEFGCSQKIIAELGSAADFDELVAYNHKYLGSRMERSRIRLGNKDDYVLSGEELLRRTHTDNELDPTLTISQKPILITAGQGVWAGYTTSYGVIIL